ncbi:hypothetical protein E2C01_071687 [Portunus trituberculatus]|uniref:Uncharacterized protein n=1 Tax=Portunus trituberculatus TaxID=210409 RepID=A0A5B7I8N3_PORTR|nr:hypothetical protein [Portunus trituberculatus]
MRVRGEVKVGRAEFRCLLHFTPWQHPAQARHGEASAPVAGGVAVSDSHHTLRGYVASRQ